MKHSLKENVISFLLGCIIGIPLVFYAQAHRTSTEKYQPQPETHTVELETISPDEEQMMQEVQKTAYAQVYEEMYYDNLELLACCVEAEAGNQGLYGKQLVIDVILNRVDDPDFPDCITDVIMQPNQFSVVLDGRINEVTPTEETYEAIRLEFEHRQNTEILFFTAEGFSKYGTPWMKIGDHYFSTKKVL